MQKRQNWIGLIGVVVITAVWLTASMGILVNYETEKRAYVESETVLHESQIDSIKKTYENFAAYIFEQVVNTSEVLDIMAEASEANESGRAELRGRLYGHLKSNYDTVVRFDFRQLHFHFKNGDSFLRFHDPEQYGDNLFSIRDSIRIANQEKRVVAGFEEGRIFNGYRFVFPLIREGVHIGSVEVSISLAAVINQLKELYPEQNTLFMLERNVVESTVFDTHQQNYVPSVFSEDYLMDRAVNDRLLIGNNRGDLFSNMDFLQQVKSSIGGKLNAYEAFAVSVTCDQDVYFVQFLPLKNISQKPVGYFVSAKKNSNYKDMDSKRNRELIQVGLVFLLAVVLDIIYGRYRQKVRIMATTDSLTKALNRHRFTELAEHEMTRSTRHNRPLSLLLFDLDHFKLVNDTHGHNVGDAVLKSFSEVMQKELRSIDMFARWGGEEFAALLPETGAEGAEKVAERLRLSMEKQVHPVAGTVTVSIGVAIYRESDSLKAMVKRADDALYRAKSQGRNRVMMEDDLGDHK